MVNNVLNIFKFLLDFKVQAQTSSLAMLGASEKYSTGLGEIHLNYRILVFWFG